MNVLPEYLEGNRTGSYTPEQWLDEVKDKNSDEIIQEGTPMDAEHFNHMEQGIHNNSLMLALLLENVKHTQQSVESVDGEELEVTLTNTKDFYFNNSVKTVALDIMEWEEILFFARNHDWFQEDGELEWNIFNNNCSRHSLILSPNVNGNIRGDILATISVIPNKTWNNKLDLYWEPGFKANERCMDRFDNVVKWKADYTAEWIKNRLLEKSHTYYEKCNDKKSFWQKIWN